MSLPCPGGWSATETGHLVGAVFTNGLVGPRFLRMCDFPHILGPPLGRPLPKGGPLQACLVLFVVLCAPCHSFMTERKYRRHGRIMFAWLASSSSKTIPLSAWL